MSKLTSVTVLGAVVAFVGVALWAGFGNLRFGEETEEIEHTDYKMPDPPAEEFLADDRLEDKKPPAFDPALVDPRPLAVTGEWSWGQLNASAAVVRLDVPPIRPDQEPELLVLHPSYAAVKDAEWRGLLPSVNLIDGKAKQFDDGLYAALDLAYYQGLKNTLLSHVELVKRLYEKTGKASPAAPYLAAGLELAGAHVEPADSGKKEEYLSKFRADETASKPIGFYTWNENLSACFRFLRFFQREFGEDELNVPVALAEALAHDPALLADYQKAVRFYARLTNPLICLSAADLVGPKDAARFAELCKNKKVRHAAVALFPPSTSKETVLFEKLFPLGLPPDVNLMRELVQRIRSGEVDLRPNPKSGWYEYQVHALETLLLPEKGEEKDKLLLTRAYKKRMLEAFQALVTKRRETHVRQLGKSAGLAALPPEMKIKPRLRLEPCPSYYLRTARAYAFLINFLDGTLGKDALRSLHGLKQDGKRTLDLASELRFMRDLFHGLYLMSAQDIGLKPALAADESVDQPRCLGLAADWLNKAFTDEDLAVDTRVAVPIYVDYQRGTTRLWLTLGVRLARLDARYARPPQVKSANGTEWQAVNEYLLEASNYLIPVDEFAEVELPGLKVLSREELRAICDREKTKEQILAALQK
jgi:hypothetical protein